MIKRLKQINYSTKNTPSSIEFIRWKRQTRSDLKITITILAFIASLFWITSSSSAFAETQVVSPQHSTYEPSLKTETLAGDIWLSKGSVGAEVLQVQTFLSDHGWSIAIDGDYGPQTERIVTRFQESSGLYTDGIVGPVTWKVIKTSIRGPQIQVMDPPQLDLWTAKIPQYSNRGACSVEKATIISQLFGEAGANIDTQTWYLLVASRESGCDNNAHFYSNRTRDDSYGWCQLNAKSGHFGSNGILAGWDRNRILVDFEYNTKACVKMWTVCGRGPWVKGDYGCSIPEELILR